MPIDADYQAELEGVVMGTATCRLDLVTGALSATAKSADVDLDEADGEYAPPDHKAPAVITLEVTINEATAEDAMDTYLDLLAAFAPTATDVDLQLRLPGLGHVHFEGRPRGLVEDLTLLGQGVIRCLGTFKALDPTMQAGS